MPPAAERAGEDVRPTILCMMRHAPARNGTGASQRAWFLLDALREIGEVHFVLISRRSDRDIAEIPLGPIEGLVRSVTRINVPEWEVTTRRRIGPLEGGWLDVATMRSQDAPRLSTKALRRIADQLPVRAPDILFAGRLPTAIIARALIAKGMLSAGYRFADFDDVMSTFKARELRTEARNLARQGRLLLRFAVQYIRTAERRIIRGWDGVSTSGDSDSRALRALHPSRRVVTIPNVVERDRLPDRVGTGPVRLLFVGHLSYLPNTQGLEAFLEQCWPDVRAALPGVSLTVVGLNPSAALIGLAAEHGVAVHANVPSVTPYYEDADIVIVPLLIGSGTRVKIIEAMAYGRAIVSTAAGAEGLNLEDGVHAAIVPDMAGFAGAVIALAKDEAGRRRMVGEGLRFQRDHYSPVAMNDAVAAALGRVRSGGSPGADDLVAHDAP